MQIKYRIYMAHAFHAFRHNAWTASCDTTEDQMVQLQFTPFASEYIGNTMY
ncbi:Uncharacterised protein [Escherichia coli]|uniref:Uncharacterized protein n=1 Tax=Escherichia coli TaxID=562 RepID=A0A377EA98_ECOLX|nr:Uncharacterised protein [Escherichia coli]